MSKFVWIQSGVMLLVEGGRGQGSVLCGAYNLNVGPYQSSRECLDIFNFHPTQPRIPHFFPIFRGQETEQSVKYYQISRLFLILHP